ncbi:MAG: hypothetical protein HW416_2519 [Chloroflexi bacterium]|nr:hypothetical protein [Chloroflexota bacterium]
MRTLRITASLLAVALMLPLRAEANADDSWLDAPIMNWNTSGMAVPVPEQGQLIQSDARCPTRPGETTEDSVLSAAGWQLYGAYQAGWGVRVIWAKSGTDGMCRPAGYQGFVFVDGALAGTIAPAPMVARFDGAAQDAQLISADNVSARFLRYATSDPLCCPSRPQASVQYRIDRAPAGPVLVPTNINQPQS